MAYLGNDDLGEALQIGGTGWRHAENLNDNETNIYDQLTTDFYDRVEASGSGMKEERNMLLLGSGKGQDVELLGQHLGHLILKNNPHLHASGVLSGGSFWDKLKKGFTKAVKFVAPIVKKVAPVVAPGYGTALKIGMDAVGLGKKQRKTSSKKPRKKRAPSLKMKKRGELVSQLMKQEGMTLPEASRYIKDNNLI